jgi:phage terminase large subunit
MVTVNPIAQEKYIQTAHDAGMPRNQLENFVNAGYVAQPKQCLFHAAARAADKPDGPSEILLGGARGGAKSHGVMAQAALDDCARVPGLRWLYLRSIKHSATEAFADLVDRVMRYEPHEFVRNEGLLRLPNGSHMICGGFKDETDIDKYIGLEYDGCTIEEATTISPRKLEMLYGSIRSSRDDWRPRKYLTTNPGGIGHQYIKSRFVLPHKAGQETTTAFIPSTYQDNAFLDAGYIDYLEKLTGILGRMWRDGDWDVAAGMAFPDFSYERHTVPPFEVSMSWPRARALDYGFVHPMVALWRAKDPANGRIYVYREYSARMLSDQYQARAILDQTPEREHISITFASPDMWQRKSSNTTGVTTPAKEFEHERLVLTQADDDRKQGVAKLHRLFADLPDGKPGMQITRDCDGLIECIQAMLTDPKNPEDALKVDADPETGEGGDDYFDCLKYLLTDAQATPIKPHKREPLPLQRLSEGRT